MSAATSGGGWTTDRPGLGEQSSLRTRTWRRSAVRRTRGWKAYRVCGLGCIHFVNFALKRSQADANPFDSQPQQWKHSCLSKYAEPQNVREVSEQIEEPWRKLAIYPGAGSRIRTDDLLITNQLLYQLSYAGTDAAHITAPRRRKQAVDSLHQERPNVKRQMIEENRPATIGGSLPVLNHPLRLLNA